MLTLKTLNNSTKTKYDVELNNGVYITPPLEKIDTRMIKILETENIMISDAVINKLNFTSSG